MAKGRNGEMVFAGTSLTRDNSLYSVAQFAGVEAEWPWPALVGHPAGGVNQVEAVWPSGVGPFSRIPELIEHGTRLDSELANTCSGDESSIFFTLRTGEDHAVLDVALHLPDVVGVGFGDVDDDKLNLTAILVVKLVQGRNLPPERRSGVAPKDQHDGPALRGQGR